MKHHLFRVIFKLDMQSKDRLNKVVSAPNSIGAAMRIADLYGSNVHIIRVIEGG
jgi:hypothetical protein